MKKLEKYIPKYTYIPFALICLSLVAAFYATRLFTTGGAHYDVSLPLDARVPLCTPFIAVYVLAYCQ